MKKPDPPTEADVIKAHMAAIGAKGGKRTSEKKKEAARATLDKARKLRWPKKKESGE